MVPGSIFHQNRPSNFLPLNSTGVLPPEVNNFVEPPKSARAFDHVSHTSSQGFRNNAALLQTTNAKAH